MTEVQHQECPFEDCGSSDAFNYNTDGYGFCQSCKTSYPSRKRTYEWAKERYPVKERETSQTAKQVVETTFKGIRGLDEDVAKLFGIQKQTLDDDSIRYAFKYPNNVKYRDDSPAGAKEKKFWNKNKGAPILDLFGPDFNANSSNRLYLTEGECFLPDTEVLTPNGWVPLEDYKPDTNVVQVDQEGRGSFTKPLAIVDKNYDGNLIEYKSNSYYSITTENHSLVRINKKGELSKYPATKRIDLRVPRTLWGFAGQETRGHTLDQLRAWIMLSADFSFRPQGDIYGSFKKERKVQRAKEILDTLGVRYSSKQEASGYTNIFIHRGHGLEFVEKDLPWEVVYHSDRKKLLEEVLLWDGNEVKTRNQSEFSTNRKHNADVVQALAHVCGYTSTLIYRQNEHGYWIKVSILYGKQTSTTQRGYKKISYSGRVMCLTVPTGMLLVRQKGSVSISGNCDAASLYQALGKTYPVKGLPTSSINEKFLAKNHKLLSSFREIVYAGELDAAGKKAADILYNAFPDKFFFVPMTKHKDANDFLTAGDANELKWTALKPQRYTPDNFFTGDNAVEKAITEENPYEYYPTGHSGLDDKMRGLVKGGITFIKAPRGTGKCLHPDQGVMLKDGTVCKAKDIKVGDRLLSADGADHRTVLSTTTGKEEMFRITPVKGDPWVCNRSHILRVYDWDKKAYLNISVNDYLKLSASKQKRLCQVRMGLSHFDRTGIEPRAYNPYIVGLYLGDGSLHNTCVSLGRSKENCVKYLKDWAQETGFKLSEEVMRGCIGYHISTQRGKPNPFQKFKETKLMPGGVRQIPHNYKIDQPWARRMLLAGLLDADGYKTSGCFEIVQKSKKLAEDICFVARSLGKAAYIKEVTKGIKSTGFEGTYYMVTMSGDFTDIPFKRHKVEKRQQIKNVLHTGFKVESLGEGDYCGFEIDGDKLFVLEDFTITHNTELARYFETGALKNEGVRIALLHAEEMKSTTYRAMATYELGKNVRTKDDAQANEISEAEVIESAKRATKGDRTIIFEMRGSDDPMRILDYIRLAATVYGAEFIFIDHIQRLAYLSQTGVDGATSMLTALGSRMAQMCKELNIGVICISQVNDDGRTKYAAALEEEAIICIKLLRDLESEDERVQNTTEFDFDKNRPFSKLGKAGKVFFDSDTTILTELIYDA